MQRTPTAIVMDRDGLWDGVVGRRVGLEVNLRSRRPAKDLGTEAFSAESTGAAAVDHSDEQQRKHTSIGR